jgi:hypothetical protein
LNWDGHKYLPWLKYLPDLQPENAQVWALKKTDKAQALLLTKKSQMVYWGSQKLDSLNRIYYYTSFYEKC